MDSLEQWSGFLRETRTLHKVNHILRVLSLPASLVLRGDTRRSHTPVHFGGLWRTSPLSYSASVVADLLNFGWVGIGSGLYPISRLRFVEVTIRVWRSRFFILATSSEECFDGDSIMGDGRVCRKSLGHHLHLPNIKAGDGHPGRISRPVGLGCFLSHRQSGDPLLEFLCSGVGPCRTLSRASF